MKQYIISFHDSGKYYLTEALSETWALIQVLNSMSDDDKDNLEYHKIEIEESAIIPV